MEGEWWVPWYLVRGVSWLQMYDLVPLPISGTAFMPFTFTDPSALFRARRNSRRDTYQPPLASDIEKMKTMHLKEQKAFALIREILGRQPRLPMSDLPTCWFLTQTWKDVVQSLFFFYSFCSVHSFGFPGIGQPPISVLDVSWDVHSHETFCLFIFWGNLSGSPLTSSCKDWLLSFWDPSSLGPENSLYYSTVLKLRPVSHIFVLLGSFLCFMKHTLP